MSENKTTHDRDNDKLFCALAKHISNELNVPVYVIEPDLIEEIVEEAKKIPEIEKIYTENELREEVSRFMSKFPAMGLKSEFEAEKKIKEFFNSLKKKKKYEALIVLVGLSSLPVGTKIGGLEIVEQDFKKAFPDDFLKYHEEKKGFTVANHSKAKLLFSSHKSVRVADILEDKLELPFAILSLLMGLDIDLKDCVGVIKSTDSPTSVLLEPQRGPRGYFVFIDEHHGKNLERLSAISTSKSPTRLQKKILQAIQTYGLTLHSKKAEIRFLLLVISLESLLLTKNDRDYLGKKLSEKTAFLLEKEYNNRIELYSKMKKVYKKRSDIVHKGNIIIIDSEVRTLEYIFKAAVFTLLELSETYLAMEQKKHESEQDGVEDLINQLKFS